MIASLPMYARRELDAAHDRYWALIRDHLRAADLAAPDTLTQGGDPEALWTDPALVLGQTCGLPYRARLHDRVHLVGTPDYGVADCPPGHYRSALVIRADDPRSVLPAFRDARFAFNQPDSQSGVAAPYAEAAKHGFWFGDRLRTGAHRASAEAVARNKADIAALDAVSWQAMTRFDAFADGLRVLCWTEPTPGLPYICAPGISANTVFEAVAAAMAALDLSDRDALGLRGIVRIAKADYLAMPTPPPGSA